MSQSSRASEPGIKNTVKIPKEKMRADLMFFGETLQQIIKLQGHLAMLPMQEQVSKKVLLEKVRIYENSMSLLLQAFEQLAITIMAKQAGGRPAKTKEFKVAWDIAVAHYKEKGRDLSDEALSRQASKKLMKDDPDSYKKCVGWDALGEEDIPRPFPKRTASDCLFCVRASRPYEE
jgi:hypothetical protein